MHDSLIEGLAARAQELFLSREMYCAEAILCVLNEGLGGGLEREQARGLAMGFGQGLGEAGCVCGALAGSVLAASWFLSKRLPPAEVRKASRELHDRFKAAHGSACCRVLTKHVKGKPKEHFSHCAGLTRAGAALAASVILTRLPDLEQGLAQYGSVGLTPRRGFGARAAALLRRVADRIG